MPCLSVSLTGHHLNRARVDLVEHRLFLHSNSAASACSFLNFFFHQPINAAMLCPCLDIVSQHLCPAELWASHDVHSACKSTSIYQFFPSYFIIPKQWTRSYLCTSGMLFVGCLMSQQHASVSQGRICSDNCTCCHTETEASDQTIYLTQSQYTDTRLTSPSADPITPGSWQGSHWIANL